MWDTGKGQMKTLITQGKAAGASPFVCICISINTAVALMMGKPSGLVKREFVNSCAQRQPNMG